MPRQQTWGVDPRTGLPTLTSPGVGLLSPVVPSRPTATPFTDPNAALLSHIASQERPTPPPRLVEQVAEPADPPRTPYTASPSDQPDPTARPEYSGTSPRGLLDLALPGSTTADKAINRGIDALTGLPFGIASTLLNPRIVDTSWGTDFNTGGGGIIGAGGELSRRNLERIHANALAEHAPTGETNADYLQEAFGGGAAPTWSEGGTNNFYAPGDIPGVNTPIATSEGIIPGTRVASGVTDRLPEGIRDATQIDTYAAERQRIQEEADRQAEIQRLEDQRAYAAAEAARVAEEQRLAQQAAEAAERTRREQEAARIAREQAAREEAQRAANEEAARQEAERLAEAQRRANETGRDQNVGTGSAVTDRHGNPVRDSSGGVVTDNRTTVSPDNDDGGGGGGGGTHCCTAAYRHGMPIKKIKELRKWHRQQSQLWQDGYDQWGYFIAQKLVKNSPFWASVTEAGHDLFVNKKVTPKSILAWLVIAPGSYITGGINAVSKRKAKTLPLGE